MSDFAPTPETESIPLSFEEFTKGTPVSRFQNFWLFFATGDGEYRRREPYYQRFATEHPEMAETLCKKIQGKDKNIDTTEALKPFHQDLYEAYKIIRGYGVSHQELFT